MRAFLVIAISLSLGLGLYICLPTHPAAQVSQGVLGQYLTKLSAEIKAQEKPEPPVVSEPIALDTTGDSTDLEPVSEVTVETPRQSPSSTETTTQAISEMQPLKAIKASTTPKTVAMQTDAPQQDTLDPIEGCKIEKCRYLDLSHSDLDRLPTELVDLPSLNSIWLPANIKELGILYALPTLQNVWLPSQNTRSAALKINIQKLTERGINVGNYIPKEKKFNDHIISFLTGDNFLPFVSSQIPSGGFSTELISIALFNAQGNPFEINIEPDWTQHITPLLIEGQYDIGYPWFRPNCENYEFLSKTSRWLCDNIEFSAVLHDIPVAAYASAETAAKIQTALDAKGLRICRPEGYFTFDLDGLGLNAENIERISPKTPEGCFTALLTGNADVVTLSASVAKEIVDIMNLHDQFETIPALQSIQTLHAIGMKSNPYALPILERLNLGLQKTRDNGTYEELVEFYQ